MHNGQRPFFLWACEGYYDMEAQARTTRPDILDMLRGLLQSPTVEIDNRVL
jgi:hypothetical protein